MGVSVGLLGLEVNGPVWLLGVVAIVEAISNALPLSYAVDAMQELVGVAEPSVVWSDIGVVLAFALAGLALGAATLRRRTA